MGQLLDVTEASLRQKTAEVYFLWSSGMSIGNACKAIGLSKRQYYYWLPRSEDLIRSLLLANQEIYKEELAMILTSRPEVLEKVIDDALSPDILPIDRLAILQHLEVRSDILNERVRPPSGGDLASVIGTPLLKPGTSRFAGRDLEIAETEDGALVISARQPDVIDITPTEPASQ